MSKLSLLRTFFFHSNATGAPNSATSSYSLFLYIRPGDSEESFLRKLLEG